MTRAIQVEHIKTFLGEQWIHQDVSFLLAQGNISALVGGSGCGKSVLLREMLGLLSPTEGDILIFGQNIRQLSAAEQIKLQQRCGILFQQGALFSSLTVLENLIFPLQHFTTLNRDTCHELALCKLALVGLKAETIIKYPAELSGGMQKRVALARALMLEPEILFLDEPSAGLDPVSVVEQDDLLRELCQSLSLSVVMVTHDLGTLATIVDDIIFLNEGKVLAQGTFAELKQHSQTAIHDYFHSIRGAN